MISPNNFEELVVLRYEAYKRIHINKHQKYQYFFDIFILSPFIITKK